MNTNSKPQLSHAVVRTNLRTGARYLIRWAASMNDAALSAARSNDMHRACGMTHLFDRAISGRADQVLARWTDYRSAV